jgi:glycosyltransferase involved in cell wall biosynthesis
MEDEIRKLKGKIQAKLQNLRRGQGIETIAVCAAQVPFFKGGAEAHVDGLVKELQKRGYDVDLISIPYKWYPREQLWKTIRIWQMLDLAESNGRRIDKIITTKFPSYFADHANKTLWLIHQYRQAYDLLGTCYSDIDLAREKDRRFRDELVAADTKVHKTYTAIYTNSQNTANRLKKFNGLDGRALYHPPRLAGRYYTGDYEDCVLSVGRLDPLKRVDVLISSLRHCRPQVRCKIAGTGPELPRLRKLANRLGVEKRVDFLGFVPDDELLGLYANSGLVYFAPIDEDYGYITLEAFLSRKPVITCRDSGGPLEFIEDGTNGLILSSPDEKELGGKIDDLLLDKERCRAFGQAGYQKAKDISWDHVIESLLEN